MATPCEKTVLPPALDSTSEPPPIFDGTIRLYISYTCPFAQRAWIARNHKGLQDKIKLVAINLQNRPAWYKEKVYPENKNQRRKTKKQREEEKKKEEERKKKKEEEKARAEIGGARRSAKLDDRTNSTEIGGARRSARLDDRTNSTIGSSAGMQRPLYVCVPSLEHNNKVIAESLDLLKYIDSNFEGPSLLPNDPAKRQFAEEMLSCSDTVNKTVFTSFKGDPAKETGGVFDYLETALHKFDDGPFFLGQFSMVDIAYVPFIERFQLLIQDVWKYDIMAGRPKLEAWFEEMNKVDAYKQSKYDPKENMKLWKKHFLGQE